MTRNEKEELYKEFKQRLKEEGYIFKSQKTTDWETFVVETLKIPMNIKAYKILIQLGEELLDRPDNQTIGELYAVIEETLGFRKGSAERSFRHGIETGFPRMNAQDQKRIFGGLQLNNSGVPRVGEYIARLEYYLTH